MGISSEDSPPISGNLLVDSMLTVTHSCSTSLPPGDSLTQVKEGSGAMLTLAPSFKIRILMSYMHVPPSMVIISVSHKQINLVTVSASKVARTCSLTRRMDTSQSQR